MEHLVKIDGSMGEGGGQILRTSLSMSAVYGRPFEMVQIRANREKPGLKRQHLTCVKAVAEICGAKVNGAEVGSLNLTFDPGPVRGGVYRFDIGTAGSVTLVAQTVIPILLRADAPSIVTITGGTHVPMSPSWDFFELTYLPQLRAMGAEVEGRLIRHGFYPAGGGEVELHVKPIGEVRYYKMLERGRFLGGKVTAVVSNLNRSIAEAEVDLVTGKLEEYGLEREVREVVSTGPGNYCFAQLNFENITVVVSDIGTYNRSRKSVANSVVDNVRKYMKCPAAVEVHLSDQLLVPLGVMEDDGKGCQLNQWAEFSLDKKFTRHYLTNWDVLRTFMVHWNWSELAILGGEDTRRICVGMDMLIED